MKVKTSELTNAALDWAIGTADGGLYQPASVRGVFWIWPGEPVKYSKAPPAYSTDWAQGGPIIEREHISTEWSSPWDCWTAQDLRNAAFSFTGPTPLIAAMRSYVASKFGDEVAVPDELLS